MSTVYKGVQLGICSVYLFTKTKCYNPPHWHTWLCLVSKPLFGRVFFGNIYLLHDFCLQ